MQYTYIRVIINTDKGKADNPQTAERLIKMKKFETVTDYEILVAASSYYLGLLLKEYKILEKNPHDRIANSKYSRLCKIYDELHCEIVILEKSLDF